MSYTRTIQIEFNHCDPAGIVFYPRYFEMTNSVIENFFGEVLNYPFARITMEEGYGVPTVHIGCDFRAPSRLGDKIDFTLRVVKLGTRSVGFQITAAKGAEVRLTADLTLVWVNPQGQAEAWPDSLRKKLSTHLEGAAL